MYTQQPAAVSILDQTPGYNEAQMNQTVLADIKNVLLLCKCSKLLYKQYFQIPIFLSVCPFINGPGKVNKIISDRK